MLRIFGSWTLDDCVSTIGILEQMAVMGMISPELHITIRGLNVHLVACFEIDHQRFHSSSKELPLPTSLGLLSFPGQGATRPTTSGRLQ